MPASAPKKAVEGHHHAEAVGPLPRGYGRGDDHRAHEHHTHRLQADHDSHDQQSDHQHVDRPHAVSERGPEVGVKLRILNSFQKSITAVMAIAATTAMTITSSSTRAAACPKRNLSSPASLRWASSG